jgi:protocatechuate 3,4-dioxygenase beta subunit
VNTNSACPPVAGASVEIWLCDVAGDYSQLIANGRSVKVTQIAFPESVDTEVYRSGITLRGG